MFWRKHWKFLWSWIVLRFHLTTPGVPFQSSLKILTHAPDYEERVIHVEGLKNRLEAMSSPHLVQAFNSNDLTRAQFFVKVFADMDRSLQLLKYYRKVKKWHFVSQTPPHSTLEVNSQSKSQSERGIFALQLRFFNVEKKLKAIKTKFSLKTQLSGKIFEDFYLNQHNLFKNATKFSENSFFFVKTQKSRENK